jgi:hypothetical protein
LELNKRKYKKSQVEDLIIKAKEEFAEELSLSKEKVVELIKQNKKLSLELEEYKNKEALINSAIVRAEQTANEIEKIACEKYSLEVENLRTFHLCFKGYFDYLMEKYPYYPAVSDAKELYDKLIGIVSSDGDAKNKIDQADQSISLLIEKSDSKVFNPKEKINEYIAATGDNGFDLDQVLNPGELHLEDLCKELGLIEE